MANVQGKFYTSETQRRGVTPSSPPNSEDDPQDPISPSSPVSFITLTDTPSSYSGQTLKGVRVNAGETGLEFYTISSGGIPPIDGSYASQALMIADQANQTAQYIYFDGTQYWEYLGTTTPSIADYRAISAGGGGSNWTVLGANIYRNSRVLIGTTAFTDTTAKLEVSGRVSQIGLGNSTYFGFGTGASDDLTTNNNSAFGYNCLPINTSGNGNSAFGISSLALCVTGVDNSAFGRSALSAATNNSNCAFGAQAGQNVSTGSANCAFGATALFGTSTGQQNSAFGGRALFGNTASGNAAFGYDAMYTNSSGTENAALGALALRQNLTSSFNTAIGSNAAYSVTGAQNTIIGRASMYSSTTGSNNIAIGYHAGRYITGGLTANVLCNNSVFLGHSTNAKANNETNQIVIGYNATGFGSNTAVIGNASIILTVLRGTINMANTPTSSAGLVAGDVWSNGGILTLV